MAKMSLKRTTFTLKAAGINYRLLPLYQGIFIHGQ